MSRTGRRPTGLDIVGGEQSRTTVLGLVRSAVSSDKAAGMLRRFLSEALVDVIEPRARRRGQSLGV